MLGRECACGAGEGQSSLFFLLEGAFILVAGGSGFGGVPMMRTSVSWRNAEW